MSESNSIDISDMPDVIKVVEHASKSGRSISLRQGQAVVATVQPTIKKRTPPRRGKLTQEQIDRAMSAAGSWRHIDAEEFIAQVYATREMDDRPEAKF